MKQWQHYTMSITGLVITIAVIGLGIYDFVVVVFTDKPSISTFLKNVGMHSPMFNLTVGFILGHLFGPMALTGAKKVFQGLDR